MFDRGDEIVFLLFHVVGDFGVISVEHRVQGEIVDTIEHGIFNNRPISLLLINPCFCSTSKNLFHELFSCSRHWIAYTFPRPLQFT
jgi:hypothetical protein